MSDESSHGERGFYQPEFPISTNFILDSGARPYGRDPIVSSSDLQGRSLVFRRLFADRKSRSPLPVHN